MNIFACFYTDKCSLDRVGYGCGWFSIDILCCLFFILWICVLCCGIFVRVIYMCKCNLECGADSYSEIS